MFDRLTRFLRDLPSQDRPVTQRTDDPRVAAAALLFHVIDADGERHEEERRTIARVMQDQYGLSAEGLSRVLKAGEVADRESVDLYAFTRVLARHLDEEERRDFIRLLWEVVYSDGELNEVEDNLVWRIAELIGVDSRERVDLRRAVAQRFDP